MERKAAVDSVHLAGHEPIFIETEPQVKDKAARRTMDLMIKRSEALISLCYLSLGKLDPILGRRSPIDYEMWRFLKTHPAGPVFIFAKNRDRYVNQDPHLEEWLQKQSEKGHEIIPFDTPADLSEQVVHRVKDLPKTTITKAETRKAVRYEGPDYLGLVEVLSETLFAGCGANIGYISQGARAGVATVLLGCTFRENSLSATRIQRRLRSAVMKSIEDEQARQPHLADRRRIFPVRIKIEDDFLISACEEFFVEIRTIDTPGQLNAVCKVLKRLRLNINDITLRPAPSEYQRQTTIALWISSMDNEDFEPRSEASIATLARLESEVRDIIGVRSFSIRSV